MEQAAIVFIEIAGETIPAGRITITEDSRNSRSVFEYGRRYLDRPDAVAIDPVMLPLRDGKIRSPDNFMLFNGIRDASPDAFGRSLIDSFMLRKLNRNAGEAEFLLASQSGHRTGALRFGPTPKAPGQILAHSIPAYEMEIGELAQFQQLVDAHYSDGVLPERFMSLISPGADLGGARPKATVLIDGMPWLAKFSKETDRIQNAASEAGCLDLCQMAGLTVPDRRIEDVGGNPTLLVKRFDRFEGEDGEIRRRHMISSMTLLGMHESDHGMSGYAELYDGMRRITDDSDMGHEVYRRMVMNVLTGNTDDHYRNHAFLLNDQGRFEISPVYDVTPTLQASSTRRLFLHLGRAGSGRDATLENAVDASESLGLHRDEAISIANDLSAMVDNNWRQVMAARGASLRDVEMMSGAFGEAGKHVGPKDPDDESECRW